MEAKIKKYLEQIQKEKQIEILYACETGSRAWGFASPDSDYDVRFIYRHKLDWYLNLNEQKDTVEGMFENREIDISGWDIKKCLNLLWRSNPPLLEKIQSPIVYVTNEAFLCTITDLAKANYSKIATMHHYLSMAKKMYSEVKDNETVKLKKIFYALRPALACKWIMEENIMPPIVLQHMVDNLEFENGMKNKIYELVAIKNTKEEGYMHKEEKELSFFIENIINQAEQVANSLNASKGSIDDLNDFFRQMIYNK
jgi:uncharacterized protein